MYVIKSGEAFLCENSQTKGIYLMQGKDNEEIIKYENFEDAEKQTKHSDLKVIKIC